MGQDVHFSQLRMMPLIQNPAMAGADERMRTIVSYRNQWKSVASPYRTFHASCDLALSDKSGKSGFWGGGIYAFNDRAGISRLNHLQAGISLAYHVLVSEYSTLGAGVMTAFVQRSMNSNELTWGSQYDGFGFNPSLPSGEPLVSGSKSFADMGAGIVWNYSRGERYMTGNDHRKATAGLAVFHPHQPDYSFTGTNEKLYSRWVIHGEAMVGIPNTNFSFVPAFAFWRQGPSTEFIAGSLFRYLLKPESHYTGFEKGNALSFGIHYRLQDALIVTGLLESGPLDIGLSYDINLSALRSASEGKGGFELALKYVIPNPLRKTEAKRY
jgi:type IX secretion system PorP/SprF family membrane protein